MASPTIVNSASTQGGIGSSQALTMPASIVAGRALLAFVGTSGSGAGASTVISGWTKFGYCEGPTPFPVLAAFGKIAAGSDSGTITGGTTTYRTSTVYQITGWSGSLADIAVAVMSTAALDPPALSGLTAGDYLFLAAARHSATLSAAPSGYAGLINASTTGVFLGTANKAATGATGDDPGVFGGTSAAASIALTLAVAPVMAAQPPMQFAACF